MIGTDPLVPSPFDVAHRRAALNPAPQELNRHCQDALDISYEATADSQTSWASLIDAADVAYDDVRLPMNP